MLVLPQAHLEEILPAVLGGLADEAEGVRTAALAAGTHHALKRTKLPQMAPAFPN